MLRSPFLALALVATLVDVHTARAAAGDLDFSFGRDGVQRIRYGGIIDKGAALARLADGRMVVAGAEAIDESSDVTSFYGIGSSSRGGIALTRYTASGALDTTFGLEGFAVVDGGGTGARALVPESSGDLLVGNTAVAGTERHLQVTRLQPDGFPVPGASYRHPALGGDELTALLVQPDGKIVLAGNATSGGVRRIVVLRLNADLTFETGGLVSGLPGEEIEAFALARESDGRLLVAGRHRVGLQESALLMRVAADLSTTDGIATVLASTIGRPCLRSLVVEPSGTIVGAGTGAGPASDDALVVRFASDLTIAGSVLTSTGSTDGFRSVARQSDGKLVTVGTAGTHGTDILVTRFLTDLTPDPSFDAGDLPRGKLIQEGVALVLQPDDRAVVLANVTIPADPSEGYDFDDFVENTVALSRLAPDGSLDASFAETVPSFDRLEQSLATTALAAEPGGGAVFAAVVDGEINSVFGTNADDYVVGRVDADGAVDTSFGANGFRRIDLGAIDRPAAILRQADGKYVVAGAHEVFFDNGFIATTIKSFGIARLDAGGDLDPTFSGDGVLTHQFAGSAEAKAGALIEQGDGKIIAAGTLFATFDVALARYTTAGVLDGTFGSGGRTTGPLRCLSAPKLGLQSDGKLVVACGATDITGTTFSLSVARYTTGGALDTTFAASGVAVIGSVGGAPVVALFVQPDDGLVVVGRGYVLRLDAGGALDPGFGTAGIATIALPGAGGVDAAVQEGDGKLVAFGATGGVSPAPAIVRFTSTGAPDATFGIAGVRIGDPLPPGGRPLHAVLASDGTIVGGASYTPSSSTYRSGNAVLARFVAGTCGNGVLEAGEACDDGNPTSGDGCDANCTASACGNGIVAGAETCDDGNTDAGDCCDAGCLLESDGAPCTAGDQCITGTTCSAGTCGGGAPVACGTCERCDAEAGCVPDVRPSCFSTAIQGASSLQIKNSPVDAKDQLQWQIKKGDFLLLSQYGDPVPNGGDDYALCLFDVSGLEPKLLLASPIPAGGTCQGRPCWSASEDTIQYKEKTGLNGGVTQLKMKAADEVSSQSLKGKGVNLALPKMSLPAPLRMQLQSANGACFEDAYVTPKSNSYKQYKAAGEF